MNFQSVRLDEIEARFERLRLDIQDLQRKLAQSLQQIRDIQSNTPQGSGGGAIGFVSGGVVIAAGGSATADVSILVGGTTTTYVAGATIFNMYGGATTSGKTLTVGQFPDGSWIVLAQSC